MVQPVLRNSCLRIYSFNMARSMSSSWRWDGITIGWGRRCEGNCLPPTKSWVFTWMLSLTSIRRVSAFSNFYVSWSGMRRDISIPRWDQWVRRRSSDYLKEYFRLAGLLDNCRIMENVDLLMSALCQYFDWYAEKHNQKRNEFLGYSGKMDHSQTWSTSQWWSIYT